MAELTLDTTGLKCPQPMLKLAIQAAQMRPGDTLKLKGDCPTFECDVRGWCARLGKTLVAVETSGKEVVTTTIVF